MSELRIGHLYMPLFSNNRMQSLIPKVKVLTLHIQHQQRHGTLQQDQNHLRTLALVAQYLEWCPSAAKSGSYSRPL